MTTAVLILLTIGAAVEPLGPGDYTRTLPCGGLERSYVVHVPPQYDAARPVPVVLCFHGAVTNGRFQVKFTGMNDKADEAGFVVVYPNGTGPNESTLFWNVGAFPRRRAAEERDDVGFVRALLDDLATVVNVDAKRVFACGMSNGGMMSHRLGVELSDRIAAIAPVAGTLALADPKPGRAMPVLQIHGTEDTFVPWDGRDGVSFGWKFRGVAETLDFWIEHNGCDREPVVTAMPDRADDGLTCERHVYRSAQGADVELIRIAGGGHTWPGRDLRLGLIGKATRDFSANDAIWDFFQRHPLK
jgi:polyhydroxybutyrate depolymerase